MGKVGRGSAGVAGCATSSCPRREEIWDLYYGTQASKSTQCSSRASPVLWHVGSGGSDNHGPSTFVPVPRGPAGALLPSRQAVPVPLRPGHEAGPPGRAVPRGRLAAGGGAARGAPALEGPRRGGAAPGAGTSPARGAAAFPSPLSLASIPRRCTAAFQQTLLLSAVLDPGAESPTAARRGEGAGWCRRSPRGDRAEPGGTGRAPAANFHLLEQRQGQLEASCRDPKLSWLRSSYKHLPWLCFHIGARGGERWHVQEHTVLWCSITLGLSPSSRRVLAGFWSQRWDVSSFLTFSSLEDYLKKKKKKIKTCRRTSTTPAEGCNSETFGALLRLQGRCLSLGAPRAVPTA